MTAKNIIFSDRLVGLSVHNGLVRMDLAAYAGVAKGANDQPGVNLQVTHQLVMPLDAFAAATGMQDRLLKELVQRDQQAREKAVSTLGDVAKTANN